MLRLTSALFVRKHRITFWMFVLSAFCSFCFFNLGLKPPELIFATARRELFAIEAFLGQSKNVQCDPNVGKFSTPAGVGQLMVVCRVNW